MLAIFTGKEASDITGLQKPEAAMPATHENQRPELSLFAQGYYGYPGYDMFGDMFDHDLSLNGIVGVKLS